MKLNILVRLKNPVVWVQLLGTVLLTALGYFSMETTDITTWGALVDLIKNLVTNPYLVGLCLWNVWNIVNDPTTSGVSDSENAMTYTEPLKSIITNVVSDVVDNAVTPKSDKEIKGE